MPGLTHYDHGPNLAEALARLAYRVAKFHKLEAPTLCVQHPVSGEQKWSSFDEWLAWEVDQGDGTAAPVSDQQVVLARRLWSCLCQPAAQDVAGDVLAEWIEHGPSRPCPFTHPYSSKVDIRLRDGTEKLGELACNVTWFWYAHEHRDYHVVAYRHAAHRSQHGEHKPSPSFVVSLPVPVKPEEPDEGIDDSWMDAYNSAMRMRADCVAAIEQAGGQVVQGEQP